MKILVFEDEIYHYRQLRHILEELDPTYDVIGPITSVEQGRDYLFIHPDIDIIIADVQLSDGLVFDVLASAPQGVPIIFTTSHAEHAFQAFQFYSLSYLIKPIDDQQMALAMTRARRLLAAGHPTTPPPPFPTLQQRYEGYRRRFIVRTFNGDRVISLSSVRYIVSEQKTTYLVLLDRTSYAVDNSLDAITRQLDPVRFMRVNRKFIVPIEQVAGMHKLVNGKELMLLKDDKAPRIVISRLRKKAVHKWLEGRG